MGFDKGIDYITHRISLRWVLKRKIDYISHPNALHDGFLIRELIIFLILMPCDGF